jgi:PleD family two-component response regulator
MKTRMTISVEEHLVKKVAALAERSGLSSSAIVNTCVRYALPKLEDDQLLNASGPVRGHKPLSVLMVEDSETDADLVIRALRQANYEARAEVVRTAGEMERALSSGRWDIILSDWVLPDFSGLEALQIHHRSGAEIPIIIVSGRIGEEATVQAMRAGADDYVLKDRLETLPSAIERVTTRIRKTLAHSVSALSASSSAV